MEMADGRISNEEYWRRGPLVDAFYERFMSIFNNNDSHYYPILSRIFGKSAESRFSERMANEVQVKSIEDRLNECEMELIFVRILANNSRASGGVSFKRMKTLEGTQEMQGIFMVVWVFIQVMFMIIFIKITSHYYSILQSNTQTWKIFPRANSFRTGPSIPPTWYDRTDDSIRELNRRMLDAESKIHDLNEVEGNRITPLMLLFLWPIFLIFLYSVSFVNNSH